MTSMIDRVEELLIDVDYPADKDALVAEAERHGGDDDAIRTLRALPPVDYRNRAEVLRSIDINAAENAGKTASDTARQRLDDAHPGVADHMRDVEASPIQQEVGSNKGS